MAASISALPVNTDRRMFGYLAIDQSSSRAAYGIKNTFAWTLELSAAGKRQALEYTGRVAAEGDRKANIASGENAVVNIAVENSRPKETGELVWAAIERPVIDYRPSARFLVDI